MFSNYFKIAYRSLLKNKLFSGINVLGLTLGMACSLLIGLWVVDESSYDRFLPDADNVYHVRVNYAFNGGAIQTVEFVPSPLKEAIAQDIPDVAAVTKLDYGGERLVKVVDNTGKGTTAKERGHFATSDFFEVFQLPAYAGDPKAALANTDQIIISRRLADKYFPEGEALGRTLQLDNEQIYTVGAVLDDLPAHSTLQFDWLANFKNREQPWMSEWGMNSVRVFVRLLPTVPPGQAEASMKDIFRRYATFDNGETPILHPMTDMHLYSEYENGQIVGGRIEYVRIFSVVALFILLIACINFMNLATAQSSARTKEVGVRKVIGAGRSSLAGQFLGEAMLMSLVAAMLALGTVGAVLPTFNTVFEKELVLNLASPTLWLMLGGLVLVTGFMAGSYPALFLSSLGSARMLKGTRLVGKGPVLFRQTLVVFQFSLSVILIGAMLVIGSQMNYLRTKNLGLDRQNVLYVPLEGKLAQPEKIELFRQEALRQPSVASATLTNHLPVNIQSNTTDLSWPGKDPKRLVNVMTMSVGPDFISTLNVNLLAGRDFRTASSADSSNYLINEAAANLMEMDAPVGKQITFSRGNGRVVGLMKDFHLNSMHQAIAPLVLVYNPDNTRYLLVKSQAGQTARAITELEEITQQLNPDYPFTYHFLDDAYEKLYRSEQQVSALVNFFGILAVLISCLGLFGLAAFTAEQRTKEIGVRKVLGATVTSIVALLSGDLLKLVVIALLSGIPLTWWASSQWLATFEYHTELSWTTFGLASALAVGIALLTISFQSVKAALMNPVKSLRSE